MVDHFKRTGYWEAVAGLYKSRLEMYNFNDICVNFRYFRILSTKSTKQFSIALKYCSSKRTNEIHRIESISPETKLAISGNAEPILSVFKNVITRRE